MPPFVPETKPKTLPSSATSRLQTPYHSACHAVGSPGDGRPLGQGPCLVCPRASGASLAFTSSARALRQTCGVLLPHVAQALAELHISPFGAVTHRKDTRMPAAPGTGPWRCEPLEGPGRPEARPSGALLGQLPEHLTGCACSSRGEALASSACGDSLGSFVTPPPDSDKVAGSRFLVAIEEGTSCFMQP